jgi:hypothetical protein
MSVQYSSATVATWTVTSLPSVSIPPGGYFLIQEAAGTTAGGGTMPLPTPDATDTIAMGATAGNVALVASTAALNGCPASGALVIDLVGYGGGTGTANVDCFETAAGPALTNPTAALRKQNGCTDTDSNAADFTSGAPAPRNSMTTPVACQ